MLVLLLSSLCMRSWQPAEALRPIIITKSLVWVLTGVFNLMRESGNSSMQLRRSWKSPAAAAAATFANHGFCGCRWYLATSHLVKQTWACLGSSVGNCCHVWKRNYAGACCVDCFRHVPGWPQVFRLEGNLLFYDDIGIDGLCSGHHKLCCRCVVLAASCAACSCCCCKMPQAVCSVTGTN
jgi:hypothetical protein